MTDFNATLLDWHSTNGSTVAVAGNNADGSRRYAINMRVGKKPTHVGTFRGRRLRQRVYGALKCAGIYREGDPDYFQTSCSLQRPLLCPLYCKIENVVYDSGGHEYKGGDPDSYLKVIIEYLEVSEHSRPGLRKLMFETVADIVKIASDQSDSCFRGYFKNTRPTWLCSIPNVLSLAFDANGGKLEGMIIVRFQWSKDTPGTFDCDQVVREADAFMFFDVQGQIADMLGWPKNKLNTFSMCADENCFGHQQLRNHPGYIESPGCKHPRYPIGCDPEGRSRPLNPKLNCPP
ncbi:hypothetical protein BDW02DRAFT_505978 [Decorospora gaudefroyi]|uniref:Uncharacterized protein n=1 Tax=Decorospora gaudefroyi TaxID=184978 RepID=A0A6A5K1C9_9PLEO|nr:hypothetical protein BDW02DRAFT_505978 [Decorospora gaudefroyi]